MQITWLGHAGFRIEIENAVLLIDPWLDGNPMFPEDRREEVISGTTHVVLTHGHGDHTGDAIAICRELSVPCIRMNELMNYWEEQHKIAVVGFNKGGTLDLNGVKLTMVNAAHSSSIFDSNGPIYAGTEAGFMIAGEGHVIYLSGDTDIMADMEWMGDLHKPDIGILCAGGHYTMDMARAAYAAKRYFDFKTVIPCHYKTFPILAQSAQELIDALPNVNVIEPEVLSPIAI